MGTASELKTLGETLISAAETIPERTSEDWPPKIANLPHTKQHEYSVSFHLETETADSPKTEILRLEVTFWALVPLATVGLIACLKWLLSYVL